MVIIGPAICGCNRVVAALKRCIKYSYIIYLHCYGKGREREAGWAAHNNGEELLSEEGQG